MGSPYRSRAARGRRWVARWGKSCMEQLLALDERPTAVFCFNDLVASGALQAIHNVGLRVPQTFSVVGFDDSSLASCLYRLDDVRQPKEDDGPHGAAHGAGSAGWVRCPCPNHPFG